MQQFDKGLYKIWGKIQESSQLELDRILDELFSLYIAGCVDNNDKDFDIWLDKYIKSIVIEEELEEDSEPVVTVIKMKPRKKLNISFVDTNDYRIGNKYWYLKSNLLTEYLKKRNSMLLNYPFDKYATGTPLERYPIADSKLETFVVLNCFWRFYIYIPLKEDTVEAKESELLADLTYFCENIKSPFTTEEVVNFAISPYFRSMLKYKKVYHYGNLGEIDDVDEPDEDEVSVEIDQDEYK